MEHVKKQRSPWVYGLMGCGGLAATICLGFTVMFAVCAKKAQNLGKGMTDPEAAKEQAVALLGALPEGYFAVSSFDIFVMKIAILADEPPPKQPGTPFSPKRSFRFIHVVSNDNNAKVKSFFTDNGKDTAALENSGLSIRPEDIVKRGLLTTQGGKVHYVVANGVIRQPAVPNGAPAQGESPVDDATLQTGLHAAFLFDCPGKGLDLGIWTMAMPDSVSSDASVGFAGTVADEAAMVRFLKPMKPCEP